MNFSPLRPTGFGYVHRAGRGGAPPGLASQMEVDKVADMVAGININKINIWIEELSIESPRVSYLTTVIFTLVAFVFANGLRLLVGQLEDTQVSLLVHHHHLHKSL